MHKDGIWKVIVSQLDTFNKLYVSSWCVTHLFKQLMPSARLNYNELQFKKKVMRFILVQLLSFTAATFHNQNRLYCDSYPKKQESWAVLMGTKHLPFGDFFLSGRITGGGWLFTFIFTLICSSIPLVARLFSSYCFYFNYISVGFIWSTCAFNQEIQHNSFMRILKWTCSLRCT